MSMTTYAYAVIEPDEHFDKMAAVYKACTAAGVEVPVDVAVYFNYEEPNYDGVKISVPVSRTSDSHAVADYFDIQVEDIPEHAKYIRFVNSF